MRNTFVTEISEEDFRKLNLIGYRNAKVECEDNSYKFVMKPISLNKLLDKELKEANEPINEIVFAIHIEPTEEFIKESMKLFTSDGNGGCRNYTYEEAKEYALYEFSYLDKFMNRFTGMQTFQYGVNLGHIYTNRDYFYSKEDYWRVRKADTKAVYIVHIDQESRNASKKVVKDPLVEFVDWK